MKKDVEGAKHFHEAVANTPQEIRQRCTEGEGDDAEGARPCPWHISGSRVTMDGWRSQLHALDIGAYIRSVGCASHFCAEKFRQSIKNGVGHSVLPFLFPPILVKYE